MGESFRRGARIMVSYFSCHSDSRVGREGEGEGKRERDLSMHDMFTSFSWIEGNTGIDQSKIIIMTTGT